MHSLGIDSISLFSSKVNFFFLTFTKIEVTIGDYDTSTLPLGEVQDKNVECGSIDGKSPLGAYHVFRCPQPLRGRFITIQKLTNVPEHSLMVIGDIFIKQLWTADDHCNYLPEPVSFTNLELQNPLLYFPILEII